MSILLIPVVTSDPADGISPALAGSRALTLWPTGVRSSEDRPSQAAPQQADSERAEGRAVCMQHIVYQSAHTHMPRRCGEAARKTSNMAHERH